MKHVKVRAALTAELVAVVAAASPQFSPTRGSGRAAAGLALRVALLVLMPFAANATILPEDRADVMYHGYDGGGLQVSGPSILVRKNIKDKVSVWANYYVDMISSASIDVVATASPYKETRNEYSGGIDYLHGKTLMGTSYTRSEEHDYIANTARVSMSQDFFGDLSTLSIAYSRGWDEVLRNGDPTFKEHTDRQSYSVDLAQVMTKNMVIGFNYEGMTDQGYLHNPYRSVRYLDPTSAKGYSYEPEVTPGTHTSSAFSVRGMYYLPYRASVRGLYRYYDDSWGVSAWNIELGYLQPIWRGATLDLHYRYYTQGAANFYSDLYPYQNSQNFLTRDKELSPFSSNTLGIGVDYEFGTDLMPFFKRGQVSLFADYIWFTYDDFRDVMKSGAPGAEPMYGFESTVVRAYLSLWY